MTIKIILSVRQKCQNGGRIRIRLRQINQGLDEMQQAVHGWLSTYERLVNSQYFFSSYLTQEDFSRFGRNSIEVGYFMERVFPIYGIRFISLNDEYDSAKYHEDTGGINVAFKYLISEFYSRDLSVKYTLHPLFPLRLSPFSQKKRYKGST